MNELDPSEEVIFNAARQFADAEKLRQYLDLACEGEPKMRQRIERLLGTVTEADSFFGRNAVFAKDLLAPVAHLASVQENLVLDEQAGTVIGRYKLLEKIGEGGMGVVYMAQQEEPVRRRVALKIIKLGMDTKQVVARFEAERQALALMDHPNIAKVLDGGATGTGRPYFVMELVQGVPITEYCDQNQLPARERVKLFILVCQAIQSAHQKGIIHRDLKPGNILVTLNAGVPVPMVIDFGVAKATQQKLTEKTVFTNFATMIGTPAYMSPEQAEMSRLDVDTRSDIYGLGVLLYELLTGTTPFPEKRLRSASYQEMQRIILEEEPERPSTRLRQTKTLTKSPAPFSTLHSQFSTDLDWIVMKCLEKDRARRYETANGLAEDLQRHLNNEPVLARPPSAAYKFQKAFRRNKLVFGAAAAVAVALVAGIWVSTWQSVQARKAQRDAEAARKGERQQRQQAQSAQKAAETEREHSRQLLYASDMNLAQQAFKQNDLGLARLLLDRHRPQSGEEDLRGWEWRYLWQLTRSSALVTLTNRQVPGYSLSFSPDGTRLAVGWWDARVDLWDVPGRRLVRTQTESRRELYIGIVAFSPVSNLLAATSETNAVRLYDFDSGRESVLWRAPEKEDWDVRSLTFSPDGSKVVIYAGSLTQGLDTVWVVDVTSAKIESRHSTAPRRHHQSPAQLSPDNQRLYLGCSDWAKSYCIIQCLDLTTGNEVWQTEPQRDRGPAALALSPDGRILASASGFEDTTIHLWEAATGKPIRPPLEGHTGWVSRLTFTKDGNRLISASADQTIRFWDTATWTETDVLRGHPDAVYGLAVSDTAQLIASTGRDGSLLLWNATGVNTKDGYLRLPENLSDNQVMPLDGSRALLLPMGNPPEFFDLRHGESLDAPPELGPSDRIMSFNSNCLCRWDGTNQILVEDWNGAQFKQRGAVALTPATRPSEVAFNPARQMLAWNEPTASNAVFLASLETLGPVIQLKGEIARLDRLAFSEDGKYLVAVAPWHNFTQIWDRPTLRVWKVDTGQSVMNLSESVVDVAFAAGGRVLVAFVLVAGEDNEIRFYDLDHPERASRPISGKLGPESLAVSPDGRLVAATTDAGKVRLCDAVTGEWVEDLPGQIDVSGVAFSKDGRRLISAGGGREAIRLWDVRTGQELLNLSGLGSLLECAAWSADGDTILAGTPWQAWHAPSWEEIAASELKDQSR